MMMRIDKAWTDDLSSTVNDLCILAWRLDLGCDTGNKAVAYQDTVIQQRFDDVSGFAVLGCLVNKDGSMGQEDGRHGFSRAKGRLLCPQATLGNNCVVIRLRMHFSIAKPGVHERSSCSFKPILPGVR